MKKNEAMENHQEQGNLLENRKKWVDKKLKWFGSLLLVIFFIVIFTDISSTENSKASRNALETNRSTEIREGTVLLRDDEDIGSKNHTIEHKSSVQETTMWIWDYAEADGDYIQIFIDGIPLMDAFMIKNKAREIIVPTVSTVEIKGIKDGGESITYAVRFEHLEISYFNSVVEGQSNFFQLKRD